MTLQTVPPLTLTQIQDEFEAPRGTPLSAFLRGGAWVPDIPLNSGVPTVLPISILDLLGSGQVLEFPQLGLVWQCDVNTRGRTDNEPFEWIGSTVGISEGTPLPAVGSVGDGGFFPMFFNNQSGTGNNGSTILGLPPGGFGFLDNPFTFAWRANQTDMSLQNTNSYLGGFGSDSGSAVGGVVQNNYLSPGNNGNNRVEYRTPGANDSALQQAPPPSDDGAEHVFVFREKQGIPDSLHDVFFDTVFQDERDQAGMTSMVMNRARWSGNMIDATPLSDFAYQVGIFWMAFWDFSVDQSQIDLLSANPNPFDV